MSAPVPLAGFLPVSILAWEPKPWRRCCGYVTVLAGDLKLLRCPVYRANGTLHVLLPARAVFGPDGQHLASPTTGKLLYEPVVAWRNRTAAEAFSEAVVAALLDEHPEVAR